MKMFSNVLLVGGLYEWATMSALNFFVFVFVGALLVVASYWLWMGAAVILAQWLHLNGVQLSMMPRWQGF